MYYLIYKYKARVGCVLRADMCFLPLDPSKQPPDVHPQLPKRGVEHHGEPEDRGLWPEGCRGRPGAQGRLVLKRLTRAGEALCSTSSYGSVMWKTVLSTSKTKKETLSFQVLIEHLDCW